MAGDASRKKRGGTVDSVNIIITHGAIESHLEQYSYEKRRTVLASVITGP